MTMAACCLALLREPVCSYGDGEPCGYDETPLGADEVTPWGTTVAEDIASLEIAQHGTWRWYMSTDELDIENGGSEFPAMVRFVHDPASVRVREQVAGGDGVACDATTVMVGGMLTFTDEQDDVIVSVPITAERMQTAAPQYGASLLLSPISVFSTEIHDTVEYEVKQIVGRINWVDGERLSVQFHYQGQTMSAETTGEGVFSLIADFEADEVP
ncbi:hypothetical protein ACNOYE_14355 [Nannocystaceae bacterium ST9]